MGGVEDIEQLDQEFLEKLRMEAKQEIDREKQLTVERELIKNRQTNSLPNKKVKLSCVLIRDVTALKLLDNLILTWLFHRTHQKNQLQLYQP